MNKHSTSRKSGRSETAINEHSSFEVGSESLQKLKNSQQERWIYMGPVPTSQTKFKLNPCLGSETLQ